jgi:O-antigen/teichoic acid export membrane protein
MNKIAYLSGINLMGMLVPSLIAIPLLALVAQNLSKEGFGFFLIAFTITSFSGIFDFGLSKSMTRHLAKSENRESDRVILGSTFRVGIILYSILTGFIYYNPEIIVKALNVGQENIIEYIQAVKILAISILFNLLTIHLSGYFEGKIKFLQYNLIKIVGGVLIIGIPVLLSQISGSIEDAILGILISRIINFIITLAYLYKLIGYQWVNKWQWKKLKQMVREDYGMTGVNIIAPFIVSMDRLIVSNIVGIGNSVYYTAPADFVSRLGMFPAAVARTIFPLLNRINENKINLVNAGKSLIFLINILIAFPIFVFASEILNLWLGPIFAIESKFILQVLIVGLVFNNLSQLPVTNLMASGRATYLFWVYIVEMPIYFYSLYYSISNFGLLGGAITWALRNALDFIAISMIDKRTSGE